jgi:hypothetical protein
MLGVATEIDTMCPNAFSESSGESPRLVSEARRERNLQRFVRRLSSEKQLSCIREIRK